MTREPEIGRCACKIDCTHLALSSPFAPLILGRNGLAFAFGTLPVESVSGNFGTFKDLALLAEGFVPFFRPVSSLGHICSMRNRMSRSRSVSLFIARVYDVISER